MAARPCPVNPLRRALAHDAAEQDKARSERLAAALRENLRRRKAQAREASWTAKRGMTLATAACGAMRFFSDNAAAAHPKVMEAIAASNRLDTAYDGDEWSQRLDGAFSDLFETEVRAFWVTTGTAANCLALAALCPPYRAHPVPPRCAYRGRRSRRSGLLHRRRQADAARRAGRQGHAGHRQRGLRRDPRRRAPGPAGRASRSPTRPNTGWSTAPPKSPRWASWQSSAASLSTWTARASPTRSRLPAKAPPTSHGGRGSTRCRSASSRMAASMPRR